MVEHVWVISTGNHKDRTEHLHHAEKHPPVETCECLCLFTSSQATTVGPSHWAKGKPFLLASSSSSCLRVGVEDTLYEHMDLYITINTHFLTLINPLPLKHTSFPPARRFSKKNPCSVSVVPVWVCVCLCMVHEESTHTHFISQSSLYAKSAEKGNVLFISELPESGGDTHTTVATRSDTHSYTQTFYY